MRPEHNSYEIVISDLDGYTSIRGFGNVGNVVTKRLGNLLNCMSPKYFWISYYETTLNSSKYTVKLGRGSSPSRNVILEAEFSKVYYTLYIYTLYSISNFC